MNIKKILAILLILLSLTGNKMFSQNSTDDGFEPFFKKFITALQTKNKNAVCDMNRFQLGSMDFKYIIEKKDTASELRKEVFLKHYNEFITAGAIKNLAMEKHNKTELYGDENECYTVVYSRSKTSAAWFIFCKFDGVWKFTGTDNVSQ